MTSPRYTGGALDLGEIKARAEARAKAANAATNTANTATTPGTTAAGTTAPGANAPGANAPGGGLAPFFTVTEANFEDDVLRRSVEIPVIVLIGTARSQQSEQLKDTFSQLANESNFDFMVGYVDADATPQIAQALGIQNLPTTIALGGGQPLASFEGAQPREALEPWISALVEQVAPQLQGPGPDIQAAKAQAGAEPGAADSTGGTGTAGAAEVAADPRLTVAEDALNNGDFDVAIAAYDEILATEPNNAEIKQARDTTKLLKRLDPHNRTEDPIAAADARPDDITAQCDAADALVVAGDPEAAFDRLISTMQRTTGDDKAQLRERLLELFTLFDAADPRVLSARTKLASALY